MAKFERIEDLKIANGIIPFPENEQLEYKPSISVDNIPQFLRAMVGLSNTEGGCLVIGVREMRNGGAVVTGLDSQGLQRFEQFENACQRLFKNEFIGELKASFQTKLINGKTVAFVFVQKSKEKNIRITDEAILIRRQNGIVVEKVKDNLQRYKRFEIEKYTRFNDYDVFDNTLPSKARYMLSEQKAGSNVLYKYMTLDAFIQCIENGSIMFQEPSGWNDQFEKRFYNANYKNVTRRVEDYPKVFATCLTETKDSEAPWKVYSSQNKGLGRCIQIEINLEKFRQQLYAFASSNGFDVYEGKVLYGLDETEIMNLHTKKSPFFKLFFNTFNLNHFLWLLFIKRPAYKYEDEVRFFLVPRVTESRNKRRPERKYVPVSWGDLIREVRIDENCSDSEKLVINRICEENGIQLVDSQCDPYRDKGRMNIYIECFNIDNMNGKKTITISKP